MKNNIILVDIDGCCLDWLGAFIVYMKHQGHEWDYSLGEPQQYNLAPHFHLDNSVIETNIVKFNTGHWEFGTLKPIKGATAGINKLVDWGYKLVAITSCSTNPLTVALRKANLYNYFGDVFDAVHCVDMMESKRTHLADYEPTYWIEDHVNNCADGLKYGHTCLLLKQLWNETASHPDLVRCDDWSEIVKFIGYNKI